MTSEMQEIEQNWSNTPGRRVISLFSLSKEMKNIAVEEDAQGQGYGKRLLQYALDFCQRQGYEKVLVGTGNASITHLAFYQKAGFRLLSIRRDFFY